MVKAIMMILLCTMVAGTETSDNHHRRFLFNSNTERFCTLLCPLRCNNGYVASSSGCLLCRCKTSSSGQSGFLTPTYPQNIYLTNPCQPHIRYCSLKCPNGLKLGQNGCQYCACAQNQTAPTTYLIPTVAPTIQTVSSGPVTYKPHEILLSNPCSPHIRYCNIQCLQGLRKGRNGCSYCQCARNSNSTATLPLPTTTHRQPVRTTAVKTTQIIVTTQPPKHNNTNYNDPCIPSQTTCNKNCGGRYIKGPQGCQYCLCLSRVPQYLRPTTTIAPARPYGPANQTHSADPRVMTEACTVAKAICQLKCPGGFISKPENCLYCGCVKKQNDQDDPSEDGGFMVRLPNPCVQGLDKCELMCTSGYLLGPRNCEFCTCRR